MGLATAQSLKRYQRKQISRSNRVKERYGEHPEKGKKKKRQALDVLEKVLTHKGYPSILPARPFSCARLLFTGLSTASSRRSATNPG